MFFKHLDKHLLSKMLINQIFTIQNTSSTLDSYFFLAIAVIWTKSVGNKHYDVIGKIQLLNALNRIAFSYGLTLSTDDE